MQIVIPGALPDPGTAREIIPHLEKTAPTLVGRFKRSHAQVELINLLDTACTSLEYWQLRQHGFYPDATQNMSSGLGPLTLETTPTDERDVWLAELVHVSPSRDGAGLLPAERLSITPEQSLALFNAAKPLFDLPGFELAHAGTEHWRITLPQGIAPASVSPQLVSATRVNDWWPQDQATRPLRRLINELQMTWYDHPVNTQRQAAGLAPVNSLWIFGGARPAQLTQKPAPDNILWEDALTAFEQADWGNWLKAMADIDARLNSLSPGTPMVLLGEDRLVTLTPPKLHQRLTRLLSNSNNWRLWWSPQSS